MTDISVMAPGTVMGGKKLNTRVSRHLTGDNLTVLVDDQLSPQERKLLLRHLARCRRCRLNVAMVLRSKVEVPDPEYKPRRAR